MNRIKLTRAQRRRMQKRADEVDVVSQADRRFFVRRPDRQHRVRLASRAEIEQVKIAGGEPMTAPPGCRFFTVVRNIATGARMRFLVLNREDAETDLPETMARAIWEAAATPYMREIEAATRRAAGARA